MVNWTYCGYKWESLKDACAALHLDYKEACAWIFHNRMDIPRGKLLYAYIATHRYISDGLIFDSLEGVAMHYGVELKQLLMYVKSGFGIDLAVYMILRGYPVDYFDASSRKH